MRAVWKLAFVDEKKIEVSQQTNVMPLPVGISQHHTQFLSHCECKSIELTGLLAFLRNR
jgi:hypothetical protein